MSGKTSFHKNNLLTNMSLRKARMPDLINYRLRVTTIDGRQLVGTLLAFDKHMNLVLSETEEFRVTKKTKAEQQRPLGLVILRGETVVSCSVEAPPVNSGLNRATKTGNKKHLQPGPGSVRIAPTSSSLSKPLSTGKPAPAFGAPSTFQGFK